MAGYSIPWKGMQISMMKISHYRIKVIDPANQPRQPFSVVVLADLHNAVFGDENQELLQEIRKADPKMILSAGDLVVAKAGHCLADAAVNLLGELTRRYPVYCVNGNHESRMAEKQAVYGEAYEKYIQEIRSLGVSFLNNSKYNVEINGMRLALYGYELDWKYYGHGPEPQMPVEEIREKLGEPESGMYHILLAHHPHYFPAYAAWGADLTLSGHYHGGIVRLPWFGGVISPAWMPFPKYDHGLYTMDGKKMIVSAGLASHTIKLRINNPPELVILDFV